MRTKKTTLLLLKVLEKIISNEGLHARWLNSLSYLEYIGARKMLKSLPAHILSKAFLDHIHEETRHSLFFKNLAQKIAQKNLSFKEHELLVPQAGNDYFQQVDHYSVKFSFSNPVISYLYTTYVVEQRAIAIYSLYDEILKRKGLSFSLQAILNDELTHLDFVFKKIQKTDPLWESSLEEISHFEHQKYFSFLIALEKEVSDRSLMADFHPLPKDPRPTKLPPQHQKM